MSEAAAIEAGRAAWQRLKRRERKLFEDWLIVGRALAVGRVAAMHAAKINKPLGTNYVRNYGAWLRENDLADVCAQERYRLALILQHLPAIEAWRDSLSEAQRRKYNHPNSVWFSWQCAIKRPMELRRANVVKTANPHNRGRPVYWSQDCLRRAAEAVRESYSTDFIVLARRALEAAIRTEGDLIDLLSERPAPRRSIEKATAQAEAA